MRSDTIVAIVASLASLLTAAGGVWVAIRNAGRDSAVVDQRELKATRAAWLWAVRTITKLRSFIARIPGVEEPPEWKIDEEMGLHERRISGEELEEPRP
jgi:hypothetical protein